MANPLNPSITEYRQARATIKALLRKHKQGTEPSSDGLAILDEETDPLDYVCYILEELESQAICNEFSCENTWDEVKKEWAPK